MVLSIAAGIALVVGLGFVLFPPAQPDGLLAYRSATEVPSALLVGPPVSITLIRLRDGSPVHQIVAPRKAGILMVRVLPDAPAGPQGYAMGVAPESAAGGRSITLDKLHPDAEGYIKMYLPLARFVGQPLRIALTPSPATGTEPLSFRLQVAYAENSSPDTP